MASRKTVAEVSEELAAAVANMETKLTALHKRTEAIEQRMAGGAGAPSTAALLTRLEALEQRMAGGAGAPSTADLLKRLEALEQRHTAGGAGAPSMAAASVPLFPEEDVSKDCR